MSEAVSFDPTAVDFAAARAALDEAERRQRLEAEAARERAAVEAAEAVEAAFRAEVAEVIGPVGPVDAALTRLREAEADLRTAEASLSRAHGLLAALVTDAVAGPAASAGAVAAARTAVIEGKWHVEYLTDVARGRAAPVAEAEAAVRAALGERYKPVFERGVDHYIAAAEANAANAALTVRGVTPDPAGQQAYYVPASGAITNVAAGNVPLNGSFETGADAWHGLPETGWKVALHLI